MTLDDLPVVCALLLSSCGVVCVCVLASLAVG